MTQEDLKRDRRAAKAAVTREINALTRVVAEENKPEVLQGLDSLKQKFKEFTKCHVSFHETLPDTDLDPIEVSDKYFFEVQDSYVGALKVTKDWLKHQSGETADDFEGSNASDGLSQREFLSIINLPKVEIEKFSGDPLQYHAFIAVFDENVDKVTQQPSSKLSRLLQYTDGEAKKAIKPCSLIGGEAGYMQARRTLEKRFGDPHVIAHAIMQGIKDGKPVSTAKDFQVLCDELNNAQETLSKLNKLHEVDTQSSIVDIVNRLQPYLKNRWRKQAMDMKRMTGRYPSFKDLVEFVNYEVEEITDPIYGQGKFNTKPQSAKPRNSSNTGGRSSSGDSTRHANSRHASQQQAASGSRSFSTSTQQTQQTQDTATPAAASSYQQARRPVPPPCVLCGQQHRLIYCPTFKALKPPQRLQAVHEHKLCENCFLSNHTTANCRRDTVCGVEGCGQKHSKFIHLNENANVTANVTVGQENNDENYDDFDENVGVYNVQNGDENVYMPIVSVMVNNKVNKLAMLDTCSSNTFCSRSLIDELKVKGSIKSISLSTMSEIRKNQNVEVVNLCLSSTDGTEFMTLKNVFVVNEIPVRKYNVDITMYDHLIDLPIVRNISNVDVLIGQDNSEALVPLNVRKGNRGEPFGVQTLFGWSVNGPAMQQRVSKSVITHFITCATTLDDNINKLWEVENEGLVDSVKMSKDDERVVRLWDENMSIIDGHVQLPIPWKDGAKLENNHEMAVSRLQSTKRSIVKRKLYDKYDAEIDKMLKKGHAEEVPADSVKCDEGVWYLPHHAVVTDKRPDKLRVVFDCAAKFKGESLNDKCMQGPDLNNRLLYVLLRFRQHKYAIMADVEAMYYQVRVPEGDRDALRFLWYDENGEIAHYRMTSHVFGGIWCASAATYALRQTVCHAECSPMVAETVKNAFYVDDCLKSVECKADAMNVIEDTKTVLAKGGFSLTKFVVNDMTVLRKIPPADRAKEVKDLSADISSKALGIKWDVTQDQFHFVTNVTDENVTRRKMLSKLSSMFDPLGLVSPVMIVGKIMFQDVTRLKIDWDETLPENEERSWRSWLMRLVELNNLKVPRCIKMENEKDVRIELHCFSDASERAYGCCCYIRCINKNGVSVSLVMSKGKVAPIKTISIPRLELQAAVMSAKVGAMLMRELAIVISACHFWVDSEIALCYIKNDTRRFHVFVANRVAAIRSTTEPDQWHHIPGKENPADFISRGQTPEQLKNSTWLQGPQFLKNAKSDWNLQAPTGDVPADDPEVKKEAAVTLATDVGIQTQEVQHPIEAMIEYYSSWYRLKRAVAWLLKFREMLKRKANNETIKATRLSVDVVKLAEVTIIKHVQMSSYANELESLRSGKSIQKTSSVISLMPVMNEDGLMSVGGRLKNAEMSNSNKHPVIVPWDHPVAELIVRETHNIAHLGTEWTLSKLRNKFWVIKARGLLKKMKRKCVTCKKLYANPCIQKMSDLPPERLEPDKSPFTYVGVDCFGPFYVKYGRGEVKRYGCIYTCLTTRAVHIEKLDNLETDTFLNGFRRFMARRGTPSKVWSDNGTNIAGAHAELSRLVKKLDEKQVQDFSVQRSINWHFNPPNASHMGGIWERLIRTIRRVLAGILKECRLTDEVLVTALCEVESIINSRPLTKVSTDVNDMAPLTPNHLLMMKEGPSAPAGTFSRCDMYRRRWRFVQHLAQQFWQRWLKEYLPELQKRNKWQREQRNVKVGDVVLIMDENTPRGIWPMGQVVEVNEGRDGLVRSARVRTKSTELVRPITKLVVLEEAE